MRERKVNLRHALAFIMALMLAVLAVMPVMAAGTSGLTIHSKTDGHTFEAYQIFTGTISEGKLVDIDWGAGVDGASLLTELQELDAYASCKDAYEVAKVLQGYSDDSEELDAFATLAADYLKSPQGSDADPTGKFDYEINGLDEGYYLVRDKEGSLGTDADAAYTKFVLWVTGGKTEVTAKADIPSLTKEIKHNESKTWGDVGDNQIGDTVEFRIKTTVPSETEAYTSYTYQIGDSMDTSLAPVTGNDNIIDVKILVNDGDELSDTYYTVSGANPFTIDVDIKAALAAGAIKEGDTLVSYYSAVLTKDAVIYTDGKQMNKASLTYSNDPYSTGTGKTAEDIVYDWTYKFDFSKVDGETRGKLSNAKFVLSKDKVDLSTLGLDTNGTPSKTDGLIALLDNGGGSYTVVPDGTADAVYVIDAGDVVIKGLDDDITYYLYETKAPGGYNLAKEPVTFKISADYNDGGDSLKADSPKVSVNGAEEKTDLSTEIDNFSGIELPGTGGIGTTIFYVGGAVLVIAAAVMLISRRRAQQ